MRIIDLHSQYNLKSCSWALWGAGGHPHYIVVEFFAVQAFLVIGERIWRKVTGKHVGGTIGHLWMMAVIVLGGQRCCMSPSPQTRNNTNTLHIKADVWAKNGILGGSIIPESLSVIRQHLIPRLMQLGNDFGLIAT